MKMKLMKNKKKILPANKFIKGICTGNCNRFYVLVIKSYVPFTCKFSMVMHFVLILHKRFR